MSVVSRDYDQVRGGKRTSRLKRDNLFASNRTGGLFTVSVSYATWTSAQVFLLFLTITAIFEGLFLSQHFLDIFGDYADEVGSLLDALILVALSAPEVHYVLPISLLIAVYFVLLRCRERRELIVFAAAGFSLRQFIVLAFAWGALALAASLVITGVILPHTRFSFRSDLVSFRKEALTAGGAAGHFYTFPEYTVFKSGSGGETAASLFIYQPHDNEFDQAISINNAAVAKSQRSDAVDLYFKDIVAVDMSRAELPKNGVDRERTIAGCSSCAQTDNRVVHIQDYARTFELGQLFHLDPRGSDPREWLTSELVGSWPSPGQGVSRQALQEELMDRLVRGLLALTAPFFALLAVGWTTRLTQAFVLPIACGVVLGIDVLGLTLARSLSGISFSLSICGVLGVFVMIFAVALWQIGALESALIKPALSKA
jgi:lipopolysaccharide export LptBFGC system permease protein LptF